MVIGIFNTSFCSFCEFPVACVLFQSVVTLYVHLDGVLEG